jgi:hypothetical protein
MTSLCRTILLVPAAGAALFSLGFLSTASAQVADEVVLNIMRECAKIDDPTARLACYDNNIRSGGFDGRGPSVPGEGGRIAGGSAPKTRGSSGAGGFGAEDIQDPNRFQSSEARGFGPDEIRVRITDVRQREPGVYVVTLEDGAEWLFTEAVPRSFRPPQKGDRIQIMRASLGSFLMRFDNQSSVRVRRIK